MHFGQHGFWLSRVCGGLLISAAVSTAVGDRLTPSDAVALALKQNRLVRIASLDVQKAQHTVSVAKTKLLPQIAVTADEGELLSPLTLRIPQGSLGNVPGLGAFPTQDTDIKTDPKLTTLASVSIGQPLTQIPRIRLGISLAKEQTALTAEVLRQKKQEIADLVRSACYDLAQAESAKRAAEAGVAYASEAVHAAEAAVKSGAILDQVLLEAQAKRTSAEQQVALYSNAMTSARMRVNQLLGRDLSEPLEIDLSGESDLLVPTRTDATREAMENRPEVRQAERKLKMATLAYRLRQREDEPDVSLTLTAAKTYAIDVLPEPIVMVGLHMTWEPIDWGRKRAELKSRSADIEEAELGVQEARSMVALDVDVRVRAVEDKQLAVAAAQASLAATVERQRVLTERVKAGAALAKDKLEADYQVAQTLAMLTVAKSQLAVAQSALIKALGRD